MRFFRKIINIYKILIKKSYSTLSGAIAFFLIINGGSLLYLLLFISQILNVKIPFSNELVLGLIRSIESNVNTHNHYYTVFFIFTSIFGASSLFFHLLKTGEMIYEEVNEKFSVFKRLAAIVFLAAFLFIIEIFLIVLVLSKSVFNPILWRLIKGTIFVFIPFFVAVCINFFVVPHTVKIKQILKGSIFTTVFWYLITIGFSIFVNIFSNYKAIYGMLTFYIVFMIWLYLLSQGLVIGIIINEKTKNSSLPLMKLVNDNDGTPKEENEKD